MQQSLAARNDGHPEAPIRVRVGINAGEPLVENDDLFGLAVQLAARIARESRPGEILVSDVVRQLATGRGYAFVRRRPVALKGFEEPFILYAVDWTATEGDDAHSMDR